MRALLTMLLFGTAGFLIFKTNQLQIEKTTITAASEKLTLEKIEQLPEPVKEWLKRIGAVGREQVTSVYLKQSGRMKLKPEQVRWTFSEAEQYSLTDPPAFYWRVRMKLGKGMFVTGKDRFEEGKGALRVRFAGIVPIAKSRGSKKTDQSSLQRYLMELSWYPAAAVNPYIEWREVDRQTAEAVMNYGDTQGSAIFHFREDGELEKVTAWRYKESDENARPLLCTGRILDHTDINGLSVPANVEITWDLEDGPFTWYAFTVNDVMFNPLKRPYWV